eukprot:COSAG02_NODE_11951_length_1626_cov_1.146693_3_plen_194_part_00
MAHIDGLGRIFDRVLGYMRAQHGRHQVRTRRAATWNTDRTIFTHTLHDHGARGNASLATLLSCTAMSSITCGSAAVPARRVAATTVNAEYLEKMRSESGTHRNIRQSMVVRIAVVLRGGNNYAASHKVTQKSTHGANRYSSSPGTLLRFTRLTCTHFRIGSMRTTHSTRLGNPERAMKLIATSRENDVARYAG